jgi:hypothetical protein
VQQDDRLALLLGQHRPGRVLVESDAGHPDDGRCLTTPSNLA